MLVVHHLRQPPPRRYELGHVPRAARRLLLASGVAASAEPPSRSTGYALDLLRALVAGPSRPRSASVSPMGPRPARRLPERPGARVAESMQIVPPAEQRQSDESVGSPSRLQVDALAAAAVADRHLQLPATRRRWSLNCATALDARIGSDDGRKFLETGAAGSQAATRFFSLA